MITVTQGQTQDTADRAGEDLVERAYTDPSSIAPRDAREVGKRFFDRLTQLEEGTHEYQYVRNALIEMNLSLVQYAASRFKHRGQQEMEDIIQVGTIGLIKAIDRFELTREVEFTSFAVPYITGEIKRFFRDTSWAVHVPRRLQEARIELSKATEELRTRLGRMPSTAELAELMQLEPSEVAEAQKASNGYSAVSLNAAVNGQDDESDTMLADFIGINEESFELVENFHSLAPLIADLDERDRTLIHLRFVEEQTQQQIADTLGCSQMHVSRLLSRVVGKLRAGLLTTD
ncbi:MULTISPECIES: SigB/SigF/SigG family RNA polymerase sigma factor [Streptomyces]|uniref:B/F/G family RNA polymerase sigma-70 factor n=1 Tax=Streptomyces venezuelae TaxID=54571 RepID=A0A5P2BKP5_STRVZ|nr:MULTISPECIES: SigB/SigF/SigG family RNA polymerase sigma factor [Streptomyces]NEA03509.1 SigB/SigF/SigG family RNA polymerase sigma factor [Streptomyces sp. SID10116]MYY80482.1 SigB/SigF/SigG family RNA polymerase sigma factor [Streptomyces sp. SID335]MYZ12294.1 SigB/SigF/SigG family RNA polymerase sigma factor [Streptomyces sp. SID337]NDZ85069.1 SigB/SigF/SigG family RNA polymerase sigma factor [Streptomyces sp. SID10115]NEB43097.1 SigB/SigF/SigG family RNA polymerase sigma factor [Strepto